MATHLDQYRVYHAQVQAESFDKILQFKTKINLSLDHVLERVGSLETRSNALERLQDALEQRIEFLDDRRDRHANQNEVKIERLEEQVTQNTSLLTVIDKRVTEIEVKGGTGLTSGYNTGSTAFGHSEVPITPTNYQGFGEANVPPQHVEALHTRVVELEHSVDRALGSCLDQELRIQLLERATYNGVLFWKIDEFDRRRREAVDGVTLSLYSTPFYTSRHGYKMCAQVNLSDNGSHLSFFFVIMRGPFDALLQWPFKQKVTVILINQNGGYDIGNSLTPDPHSSSFQKPGRREINIASGCPMFIRIDHLLNGGFVKDDAIYVRVVVETMDLPDIIP